jgi:hypothetical protein
MTAEPKVMKAIVNSLCFMEAEPSLSNTPGFTLDLPAAVRFLCRSDIEPSLQTLLERYRAISNSNEFPIAPAEKHILEKLIWPLKQAKGSFMLGNSLGTIALCGMVAEMVAILIYEMSSIAFNKRLMDKKDQENLFGRTFERLGQERRVDVLVFHGSVDDEMKQWFETVRAKRNQYLHIYSNDHANIDRDAIEVFNAAVRLVGKAIGPGVVPGSGVATFNPVLIAYLKHLGFLDGE